MTAQQDPQWDPTLADPLYVDEPWVHPNLGTFELRTKRGVLVWVFAALVVVLAIVSAALFAAGFPR